MKNRLLLLFFFISSPIFSQNPIEKYPIDSASMEQIGVPKGEIIKFTFKESKIFPGTVRDVSVYVLKKLEISVNGSGNVRYAGKPSVSSKVEGSGTVIDEN